jgi:hypothetical protein
VDDAIVGDDVGLDDLRAIHGDAILAVHVDLATLHGLDLLVLAGNVTDNGVIHVIDAVILPKM